MFINGYGIEYLLIGLAIIITLGAQCYINTKYKQTKKIKIKNKIKGFEVAREILDKHDLKNVEVIGAQAFKSTSVANNRIKIPSSSIAIGPSAFIVRDGVPGHVPSSFLIKTV